MVLTQYRADRQVRLSVRGSSDKLEAIGLLLEQLFPGEVLVSSDEDEPDELDPSQIEVLEAMHDYQLAQLYCMPAPAC
jgi:hypothetical protein